MPKRKRSSYEDGLDAKRKKYDLSEQLQELMDSLKNYKTSQGKQLCETFIRAPKRRSLAEYYEVVSTPIDLLRIQQKIRMDEYDDLDQFTADIELLVNNTKSYFKPETAEYSDAIKLWEVYNNLKNQLFGSSSSPPTGGALSSEDSSGSGSKIDSADESISTIAGDGSASQAADNNENTFEELFGAIMSSTSEDGRPLSTMFELLPSKAAYPDYYEVISDPIDLKMIASRIQNNEYSNLNALEKDLMLMIRNAKMYNATGSQIYKDANALKKIIQQKKAEIENRRSAPASKSSERIRAKRQTPFQSKWSSIAAALKYDEEGDDCSEEEEEEEDEATNDETMDYTDSEQDPMEYSSPLWILYNAVSDTPYSEPFVRLPSKRYYPDYYREISQPICLWKIASRIKNNMYENITDLVDDLTLVFDNAMSYNRPDSKIYKDALKLKSILQMKSKEILSVYKEGAEDDDEEEEEEDEDDGQDVTVSPTKKNASGTRATRSSKRSMVNAMSKELKNVRRSQKANNSQHKRRMALLYQHLMDYNEDGRYLIEPFVEKPSRKMYPDYYDVIENPIDMKTIENKIQNDLYESEKALLNDFRLMFANCRKYNEDNSLIYQDADKLERELDNKLKELGPVPSGDQQRQRKERVRPSSGTQMKIKALYEAVRDFTDSKNRLLSVIFQKLPSKTDFPDYYEVIPRPICLEKIGSRVRNCVYETVEDLLSDIILMLDNACKYNEPDSQIFKDALTLQQIALQTKIELNEDSVNGIPDVKIIVQDLLTNLFISVYNHQDEEGRCFSDSINELSELNEKSSEGPELKTLNFDIIKRNLNLGRYRRLDRFQQDMFDVLERTRRISRTDSQAFEDSIELQSYFITLRDEICKNGQVLLSPALNYDINSLNNHIEALRLEKAPKEINEDESIRSFEEKGNNVFPPVNTISAVTGGMALQTIDNENEIVFHNDLMLKVGDFVYVQPHDKNLEPHIVYIESFKKDSTGQTLIHGCWFYRPYETYHLASRKFLEKEVFKSDNYTTTPLDQVVGKCCVMSVKDYFRSQPVDIPDEDVYVCESRYHSKSKTFKKIKLWPCMFNTAFVARSTLLPMNRVPSVFAKNRASTNNTDDDLVKMEDELENQEFFDTETNAPAAAAAIQQQDMSVLDVLRPNVPCPPPEGVMLVEGAQFYEQFSIPAGTFRVGDCCYVRTDQERNLICRIDRMWVDTDGNPYFHGPWYVQQAELPPNTIGSFYPQEVFLSSIEDTNPLLSICERCCVLDVNDYCTRRHTEFLEKDVYVCQVRYLEHEKKFEPLLEGGLKKFAYHSPLTVRDEIYTFRKALLLSKPSYQLPRVVEDPQAALFQKLTAQDDLMHQQQLQQQQMDQLAARLIADHDESTTDTITGMPVPTMMPPPNTTMIPVSMVAGGDHSGHQLTIGATPTMAASTITTPATPASASSSKKKPATKRLVTGYIIFASEVRRSVVEANPECSFGDISRIIGNQWKLLTPEQKNEFEQRAAKQNAEVKELAAAEKALQESLAPSSPAPMAGQPMENGVFECHWANKCDFQFEDTADLFEHLTGEPNGHVWVSYADTKDKEPGEFQCMFHGCGRVKKGAAPFPSIPRLIRHCREVHINKQVPKIVDPDKRSRNYVPSSKMAAAKAQTLQQQNVVLQHQVPVPGATLIQQQPGQPSQPGQPAFQTINIQHQPQLTLQSQVSSSTIPMPGHQTIMATTNHHPHAQLVATGQPGTFIQHQLIQPGQTIQGVLHQPTVVSSVPQSAIQIQTPQIQMNQTQPQKTSTGTQVKPTEPIFVAPPRPNRLLHTHAYMKYIENLKPDKRFISNWDRQLLSVGPDNNTRTAIKNGGQLNPTVGSVIHWLENGSVNHDSIENALWALRNFMHKDALNLAQNF